MVVLLAAVGCTAEPMLSEQAQEGQNLNGQNLNGQNLNGQNLNGQNLNGQNLNGPDNGTFTIWTSLVGVSREGVVFESTTLDATVFTGHNASADFTGLDMEGARFWARRGDGSDVLLWIRDIVPPADGDTLWRYYVDYLEDDLHWYPICSDANGPVAAFPINGTWDHRQGVPGGGAYAPSADKFTFACEHVGSIGKCLAMGYQPWRSIDGVNLTDHLAACVRLLRADYCGDGTPHTQNGNRVNLFDALGIEDDTEPWWVFEAEWDAAGARCFSLLNRSRAGIPCYDARVDLLCGDRHHFATGALLMNETPTAGLTP